jgi:hypothetical protein
MKIGALICYFVVFIVYIIIIAIKNEDNVKLVGLVNVCLVVCSDIV